MLSPNFGTKLSLLFLSDYSFPWRASFRKGKLVHKGEQSSKGVSLPAVEVRTTLLPRPNSTLCGLGKGIACLLLYLHLKLLLNRLLIAPNFILSDLMTRLDCPGVGGWAEIIKLISFNTPFGVEFESLRKRV